MRRLLIDTERSNELFALLVANSIDAIFGQRGVDGDTPLVPARDYRHARCLQLSL